MIAITDIEAARWNIWDKIKSARYRVRDDKYRVTYVYDRFLGLTEDRIRLLRLKELL